MLKKLSMDKQLRQQAFYREKRLHDEANALNGARREGIEEGMEQGMAKMLQKLHQSGHSKEQLSEMFDLPICEVKELLSVKI